MNVGIGYRPKLAPSLLARPHDVDFVEIVAESWRDRRELLALREIWPIVPHGVKLSLGSAEGIDPERARTLGTLARELRAPFVSEHIAFVHAGGRDIGHLTELPMTTEAVRVLARNVAVAKRALPDVPLLLENVARSFVWTTEHTMHEGEFHARVCEATGCDLLLDVANLYANARNAGVDPFALLATYPLDRVAMLHVAGGETKDGFYFDTHAHPVPEPVFALAAHVLARREVPVLLERDANLGDEAAIFGEVARLRENFGVPEALIAAQSKMAVTLTGTDQASPAIVRARGVLARKHSH